MDEVRETTDSASGPHRPAGSRLSGASGREKDGRDESTPQIVGEKNEGGRS